MMNFQYYAPTQVVFGKDTETQVGELIKAQNGTKVLVHYGTGSVIRTGLLDRVCASLNEAGIPYVSLGEQCPIRGCLWCMRGLSWQKRRA